MKLTQSLPLLALLALTAKADDFARLDEALPLAAEAYAIAPVFDFDGDGCLPSAGISRSGQQNGGLNPTGGLTSGCRAGNFLDLSNTLHRYACVTSGNDRYCGHFYALYFLKDQVLSGIKSGHRHDWEHVAIWTKNGQVTHGSYSAHGSLNTKAASELDSEGGHIKLVYHKDGLLTHAMRFSKINELAENPYGRFVTPAITSWFTLRGDGLDNAAMGQRLNSYDYGSATIPMKDSNFVSNLNNGKPADYPEFTQQSADQSQ
ncbi:NPP1 family protein [Gallaecimonas xiamenensis]|nr:NPP1 family protein [Gallaecimonas xiamenensis]